VDVLWDDNWSGNWTGGVAGIAGGSMTLIVDSREHKHLIEKINEEIPGAQVATLAYGDFIIEGAAKRYVIERKSLLDLFASVNDKRLWEQLKGIEKNFLEYRKILLIEGSFWRTQKFHPELSLARFTGIKVSVLNGWDGINVIQTNDQSETVQFLKRLVEKVGEAKQDDYGRGLGITKENRTPDEELIDLVRSIDGIGEVKAQAILEKFRTITHLTRVTADELKTVLGDKDAEHVYETVRRKFTVKKKPKPKAEAKPEVDEDGADPSEGQG
jgi:ERCC4-type nuclease